MNNTQKLEQNGGQSAPQVITPDGQGVLTDAKLGQVVFPDGECGYYSPEQIKPAAAADAADTETP